jgi:hypothetical protein
MCFLQAGGEPVEGKLSEEAQIELLIKATQNTLEQLKSLQEKLTGFRKQEAICIQSPDNAEALFKLSKSALDLLDKIHETCLEPYFRTAFLEELEIVSKAAQKHTIPPIIQ